MDSRMDVLHRQITIALPRAKYIKLTASFNITKREILAGKRYKDVCLDVRNNPRLYTQFRSWARKQQRYQRYIHGTNKHKKIFDEHCNYVNDAAICAENWQKIVDNLNDERITNIDARTLDVHQLARASTLNWCFYHNARCTPTAIVPEPGEEGTYTRDDVKELHALIVNHGVLDRIEYNPVVASSLMKSVTLETLKTCRQHNG